MLQSVLAGCQFQTFSYTWRSLSLPIYSAIIPEEFKSDVSGKKGRDRSGMISDKQVK